MDMQPILPFSQALKPRGRLAGVPEWIAAAVLCLALSLSLVSSMELKGIYRIALIGGALGTVLIIYFPRRRILLACAWMLMHPLSIEKVFYVGAPMGSYFFSFLPPAMVISASDIVLGALLAVLAAESLFDGNRPTWKWPAAMTPYALLALWSLAVCLMRRPDAASGLAVLHEFKMVVFMVVVVSAVRTPGELKLLLFCICAAVLLQAVMVNMAALTGSAVRVSAKLSGELMSFSGARASYLRATGTVGHVNQEAAYLTFFGIPLVALLMTGGRFSKTAGLVSVAGTLVAIGLTFSRGAWLSLAFGMAAILVVAVKKRGLVFRHWAYALPVLLAAAVLMPIAGKPAIDRMVYGDEGATASRKRAMLLARDLFVIHPVAGVGAGNFPRAALDYFPPEKKRVNWVRREETAKINWQVSSRLEMTQAAVNGRQYDIPLPVHNKYLLIMAELGAVGLLLFLWFQFRTWGHIKRGFQSGTAAGRWLAIGLAGAFFASQCYMNLDLFADDKTMQILLIIPVLAMINDRIAPFAWKDRV